MIEVKRLTRSSNYLIARLEALRDLLLETGRSAPLDPRQQGQDWRKGHGQRLAAHHLAVEAIADPTADSPLSRISGRCGLERIEEDILLLALGPCIDRSFSQALGRLRRSLSAGQPDVDLTLSLLTGGLDAKLDAVEHIAPTSRLIRWGLVKLTRPRGAQSAGPMFLEISVTDRVQTELLGESLAATKGAFWKLEFPTDRLEDLMLPKEAGQRLKVLLKALRALKREGADMRALRGSDDRRGAGLVLLSGPSGTGKTATAKAVASHLGAPLMTIDALALSSRIADLHSALEEIFTEARLRGALLFFDDCELLMANRLQGNRSIKAMMGAFDNAPELVLLATQFEGMLDPCVHGALLLRLALDFPSPQQRVTLWERALPAKGRQSRPAGYPGCCLCCR